MTNTTNMNGMMKKIRRNEHTNEDLLQFPGLAAERNILHFVTSRRGGVSEDTYASFNLGEYCGDIPENVEGNRRVLCSLLNISPDRLFVPYQVHSDAIAVLDNSFLSLPGEQQRKYIYETDALVTNEPTVCIAVTTADCVPVLLYAPDKKVIGVVHAGWKGTVQRIASKTIRLMKEQFGCTPEYIKAGIGPSIGFDAFEVGEEVVDAFITSGFNMEKIAKRNPGTGKAHVDLWLANQLQLQEEGVSEKNIEVAGICTYTHNETFFSARRLGIRSGRMLSGIMMNEL